MLWVIHPNQLLTSPSELFNFSSVHNAINVISLLALLTLFMIREKIKKEYIIYTLIFFFLLSFFLDENIISPNPPSPQAIDKVLDFSLIKNESEILTLN